MPHDAHCATLAPIAQIANGTTDKQEPDKPRCKKLAKAGAARIRWPADAKRDEPESWSWEILTEANFNDDVHIGWRLSAGELRRRAGARKGRAAIVAL